MKKTHKLGELINYERNKLRISIDTLAEGLCSNTLLRRIEAGERDADFFLLERLLGRLGSSINKIEILQNVGDYELLMIREYIRKTLIKGKYHQVEEFLLEYEKRIETFHHLHQQYIFMIKGILADEKEKNPFLSEDYFQKAMKLTLTEFEIERLESYLLSEEEIVLVMLSYMKKGKEGEKLIGIYGKLLLDYVDRHFRDEEAKSNLYSRLSWVIGDSFMKEKKYEEALEISLEAKERLAGNGLLINLPQLLDRILLLSKQRDESIYHEHMKMRDALKILYEAYHFSWKSEKVNLLVSYKQKNVFLISELLKQERLMRGYSQLELSEYLEVDFKTISRIERGTVLPKTRTLERLLRYFNLEMEVAETRIVTNSFYSLELEREVSKLNTYKKYVEAEKVFQVLKKTLSLRYRKNRQYVETMEAIFDWLLKRASPTETVTRLTKAFCITRGDLGLARLGEFTLSKMETVIVNNIAICYKEKGEIHRGIALLEKVVSSFRNSKVDIKFRHLPLSMILTNLCSYYEEANQFEKAIKLADQSICYAIECMRGDFLGFLLEEKTYTKDRMTGNRESSRPLYRQSYQLRKLMKASEAEKAPLEKAFLKWYGETIE